MLDIKSVLVEYNIPFATKGPNVGKNAIAIACPFCAEINNPDPSTHLRIRLSNNRWNCWRNQSHRGIDIYRLLSKLGIEISIYNENVLDQLINKTFFAESEEMDMSYSSVSVNAFPADFVSIGTKLVDKNYFRPYLVSHRKFTNVDALIIKYNLMRSTDLNSKWGWRIIAPIYMETEISWVGRSIFAEEAIKYLTPASHEAMNIKHSLFNYKELIQSQEFIDYIFITEGYMDALKLDFYGDPKIRATCTFGVEWTDAQLKLIRQLSQFCKNVVVAFDGEATAEGFKLWQALSDTNALIVKPPRHDWGEMSESEIVEFKQQFIEKQHVNNI